MRITITALSDFLQELTERGPNLEPVVRWCTEINATTSSTGIETIWYLHVEYLREIVPDLRVKVVLREALYTGTGGDIIKEMEDRTSREEHALRQLAEITGMKQIALVANSRYEDIPF